MIDQDPLWAMGPSGFRYLGQIASGQSADSPCVDAGSDLAANLGMDAHWTRTDEMPDSGIVDMGFHYGEFLFPSLQTNTYRIPESTGGSAEFLILAGSENAHRNYFLLGGVTGMDPGTLLPGGTTIMPLNLDGFTNFVVSLYNTSYFSNFMGKLDAKGTATATFDTLGPLPGGAGHLMYFAYALDRPWDFASDPVKIGIVP